MTCSPNQEMTQYWNDVGGPRWVRFERELEAQLEDFGREVLAAARLDAGQQVLDVGCGWGTLTFEAARAVGPTGSALGVDLSLPMIERARELSAQRSLPNARFERGDAQVHAFAAGAFDRVVSRFGVMFFEEPAVAFGNLFRALRAGGRLAFVCWQPPARNDWAALPLSVVRRHVTLETPPPDAPGPFSMADPERVRRLLEEAGYSEVCIDPLEGELAVGGGLSPREAAHLLTELGPAAGALREADPALRAQVAEELRELLAGGDPVKLSYAAWLVTGTSG
jgi:ubiquinone/menaquinone biosynthesis C-methylase UbiE